MPDLPPALRKTTVTVPQAQESSVPETLPSDTVSPEPPVNPSTSDSGQKPYRIIGKDIQFIELTLQPKMAVVGEISSLMYYEHGVNVKMMLLEGECPPAGFFARLLGVGKQVMSGGRLFMTSFVNQSERPAKVTFAAQYPGEIVPISLKSSHGVLFCLQSAFLCAARQTKMSLASQRELGGSFRHTGVTMQKLEGSGMVFLHAGGSVQEVSLAKEETIHVSVGAAMAIEPTVRIKMHRIQQAAMAGGGHDLVTLKGPGKVWLQSLPFPVVRKNIALYTQQMMKESKKSGWR